MHVELGDAWLHVTPLTRTLYLSDAVTCQEVYKRKEDFPKPTHLFRRSWHLFTTDTLTLPGMLNLFGKNLVSVRTHGHETSGSDTKRSAD